MIGNEKTQFKKGNKAAAKWNLEETKELFNEIKKLKFRILY